MSLANPLEKIVLSFKDAKDCFDLSLVEPCMARIPDILEITGSITVERPKDWRIRFGIPNISWPKDEHVQPPAIRFFFPYPEIEKELARKAVLKALGLLKPNPWDAKQ